jgi:hypothetical protein
MHRQINDLNIVVFRHRHSVSRDLSYGAKF